MPAASLQSCRSAFRDAAAWVKRGLDRVRSVGRTGLWCIRRRLGSSLRMEAVPSTAYTERLLAYLAQPDWGGGGYVPAGRY
ncbi:MAG: hypothetical protein IPK63_23455 [Candidatus Competibacteraceae bacterium]|nr:hypothetical protein [Candidatus Competibacteraceae bacterium]